MRVCVYGAGAIGGHLAARLAKAGVETSVVARGAHLAAIQANGLTLRAPDLTGTFAVRASDDPASLGPQDAVLVTTKAPALPSVAAGIAPLLGPDTPVVFVMNGIPWWYFHAHGGPFDGHRLAGVDPGDTVWNAVGPGRAIGGVVYSACTVVAPGVIHVESARSRLVLGEPDNKVSRRAAAVAQPLEEGGFQMAVSDRIRDAIWSKLLLNLTSGSLGILAQSGPMGIYTTTPPAPRRCGGSPPKASRSRPQWAASRVSTRKSSSNTAASSRTSRASCRTWNSAALWRSTRCWARRSSSPAWLELKPRRSTFWWRWPRSAPAGQASTPDFIHLRFSLRGFMSIVFASEQGHGRWPPIAGPGAAAATGSIPVTGKPAPAAPGVPAAGDTAFVDSGIAPVIPGGTVVAGVTLLIGAHSGQVPIGLTLDGATIASTTTFTNNVATGLAVVDATGDVAFAGHAGGEHEPDAARPRGWRDAEQQRDIGRQLRHPGHCRRQRRDAGQ